MIPGGGLSLDGQRWIKSRHPTQPRRRKPYLTNNEDLGREFRKRFVRGLRRLIVSGELRTEGEWAFLCDPAKREAWLDELGDTWNVFIEGPPHGHSQPEHVVKYLARYISGGPIADSRLISDQDGEVTFWARGKDEENKSEPFTLRGPEFVRRWSMHILPKGYTRSRSYGSFHGSKRKEYIARCYELLGVSQDQDDSNALPPDEEPESGLPLCPNCEVPMTCTAAADRPSWREIFEVAIYQAADLYSPMHHMWLSNLPVAHGIGGYG